MPKASFLQSSFLGGKWSLLFQGRADNPKYSTGMNVCLNGLPYEEGPWTRRPGTFWVGTTRSGNPARLIPFDFQTASPYNMEFSNGHLRFIAGTMFVTEATPPTVTAISTASPAEMTLGSARSTWATGDQVVFTVPGVAPMSSGNAIRRGMFAITVIDSTHVTVSDAVTGVPVNGTTLQDILAYGIVTIAKIVDFTTPYTDALWPLLRSVQSDTKALLLQNTIAPQNLKVVTPPSAGSFATFDLTTAEFIDGPYLDPPLQTLMAPNAASGIITMTLTYQMYSSTYTYALGDRVNGSDGNEYESLVDGNLNNDPTTPSPADWRLLPGVGNAVGPDIRFQASDVGRSIRFYSIPPLWSATFGGGSGYSVGAKVQDPIDGNFYTCFTPTVGQGATIIATPPSQLKFTASTYWAIVPNTAQWAWGTIQSVLGGNVVTVQLLAGLPSVQQNSVATATLSAVTLANGVTATNTWQLGAYSDSTGWPTCGCYHEGRFWLAGAIPNRFDCSMSNNGGVTSDSFYFSPTLNDGTVTDNCGISYTFNSDSTNPIFWMSPDHQGIICGTLEGEWLIQATTLNEPLTPTSIQAHRVTKYGCANIEPRKTPLTTVFIQKFQRKVMEYFADVFSGRFSAPNLTEAAKDITAPSIEELAYQHELAPIVWARRSDGVLIGATYRRTSLFSSQPPDFVGWHEHQMGEAHQATSICVGPSQGGTLESLAMVEEDPTGDVPRHITLITDLPDPTTTLLQAWYLDDALPPTGGTYANGTLTLYGFNHLNGQTASVWLGGFDAGDFLVSNGQIQIPLQPNIPGVQLDLAYLQSISGNDYGAQATMIDIAGAARITVPCIVGYTYISQGQILRRLLPQEAGAANGPALGKLRRIHQYAMLFLNTLGIKVGGDFNHLHAPAFKSTGGTVSLSPLQPFSGVWWETLNDDASFDGMIAWQITRPYPATVCAVETFHQTEDR